LPDGIFSYQKYQFGYIIDFLGMENVGYFSAVWNILGPFGICYGLWAILWSFGTFVPVLVYIYIYKEKSGNPGFKTKIAALTRAEPQACSFATAKLFC
jgi:hypothetical protein